MRLASILVAASLSCVVAVAQEPTHPSPAKAEALVKSALEFAKKNGIDKLILQTNLPHGIFHVGSGAELYILIYDMKGNCKAIGFGTETYVGKNRFDYQDPDGIYVVREFIKTVTTKGSGWVDYSYPNPATGKNQAKTTYVELFDGLVVGAGAYKS